MAPGATAALDTSSKRILVTGGAGYVGSHTVFELLVAGHHVCVIDNLVNAVQNAKASKPESLIRVDALASRTCDFVNVDLLDPAALQALFTSHGPFDVVIHFASLKAVGESCAQPLRYYRNNGLGTINLLEAMIAAGVKRFVFSSSATVYGVPAKLPIDESQPTGLNLTNPYGKTKFLIEQILADVVAADPEWRVIVLRYFNPVGAHPSGQIGEDPLGPPNNLMPYIAQVAIGRREALSVYGKDYDTVDGTGVRDYIHVTDLSLGHLAAMHKLWAPDFSGWRAYNLGTGVGYSVLQVVAAFEQASGVKIKTKIVGRRAGDIASSWADSSLAERELGWRAERSLVQMCADAWRWQSRNPNGFSKSKDGV